MSRRSDARLVWSAEELETLYTSVDLPLEELFCLIPGRSETAIKMKLRRGRLGAEWSAADLELLELDLPARSLSELLSKPRSVWAINRKRRDLNVERPAIGRRTLSPTAFPGVDWAASTNSLSKQLGLAWRTVRKLKQSALGEVAEG